MEAQMSLASQRNSQWKSTAGRITMPDFKLYFR